MSTTQDFSKHKMNSAEEVFDLNSFKRNFPDIWKFYSQCCFYRSGTNVGTTDAYSMYVYWRDRSEFKTKGVAKNVHVFRKQMAKLWPSRKQLYNRMWYLDMDVKPEYQIFKTPPRRQNRNVKKENVKKENVKKDSCQKIPVEENSKRNPDKEKIVELKKALAASNAEKKVILKALDHVFRCREL